VTTRRRTRTKSSKSSLNHLELLEKNLDLAKPTSAKILILDIETRPVLGYAWTKYQQDLLKIAQDREIICFGWKWLHEKRTHVLAVSDYRSYKPHKVDQDKGLVRELRKLLDEADIVVAHNGKSFDVPIIYARIAHFGMGPPSPVKCVDTKIIAQKRLGFVSNTLADLAQFFGCPPKDTHHGLYLWFDCFVNNNQSAWRKMKAYNAQDVRTLEALYLKLRVWDDRHPNISLENLACPVCASTHIRFAGWNRAISWRRKRYQCLDCGKFASGKREKLPFEVLTP
jgi:hypothetical protein